MQMGDAARARGDLAVLRSLDPSMAARLEKALAENATRERDGVAAQVEDIYK